jgi:signal transduction histidine kinase
MNILWVKLLIALWGIASTLFLVEVDLILFISFGLVVLLNLRLRELAHNKLKIISLLLEILLVIFGLILFGGGIFIIAIPTLWDILIHSPYKYPSGISLIGFVSYILYTQGKTIELILFIPLSFIAWSYREATNLSQEALNVSNKEYDLLREKNKSLEISTKELMAYSKEVEEAAQWKERSRISEEIHDTVGHRLTGTLMQLEAALVLQDDDREKSKAMLNGVKENLRETITILRNTLRQLKPKNVVSPIYSIESLVEEFKSSTGTNVNLKIIGNRVDLYPSLKVLLYKNTMEGLTNAVRHGHGKNVDITITFKENKVVLKISDDGIGCSKITTGMGLSAMEERTEALGGRLSYDGSSGFTLITTAPLI